MILQSGVRHRIVAPIVLLMSGCAGAATGQTGVANGGPELDRGRLGAPRSLVVLVAVDQFRGDYLERYGTHFTGGLARLQDSGAVYPNGRQNHALTQTAPGHATLLSGRVPSHTGILSNDSGVPDRSRRLIGLPDVEAASPHRFRGTTLYDWLRSVDPDARVLSVSRKDRGAILPVGRAQGDVYWYAGGGFTTSTYYADTLPTWVRRVNARSRPESFAGRAWTLLLDESAYPERDDWSFEGAGRGTTFPHVMPSSRAGVIEQIERFPWIDSLTFAFALEGVRELRLGQRQTPDLLAISLSALDAIGHDFGPDSREVRDHAYRLDRWLGQFLDSLALLVPSERTILAFSSDHGVTSMPEYLEATTGAAGGRIQLDDVVRDLRAALEPRHAARFGFQITQGLVLADVAALRARGVDIDSLGDAVAARLRAIEGVADVLTPHALANERNDSVAALWRRALPDDTGWLAAAVPAEGYVFSSKVQAEHGTLLPANMHVPIAFLGFGIPAGIHERPVDTVDIAPTLAALLGIEPTERLDGRVLIEVMGTAAQP